MLFTSTRAPEHICDDSTAALELPKEQSGDLQLWLPPIGAVAQQGHRPLREMARVAAKLPLKAEETALHHAPPSSTFEQLQLMELPERQHVLVQLHV